MFRALLRKPNNRPYLQTTHKILSHTTPACLSRKSLTLVTIGRPTNALSYHDVNILIQYEAATPMLAIRQGSTPWVFLRNGKAVATGTIRHVLRCGELVSLMILLIDNYDSFTYNLYQLMGSLGFEVLVKKHDEITLNEIEKLKPKKIVISPGPKKPENAGMSTEIINHFYTSIPILGICLGHQCIGSLFGARVVHAKEILHGKTSKVSHTGKGIFENIKNPISVARYHSLAIETVPDGFSLLAWSEDKEIMAIQHNIFPLYGIQFHPESFMTEDGAMLMNNFLSIQK